MTGKETNGHNTNKRQCKKRRREKERREDNRSNPASIVSSSGFVSLSLFLFWSVIDEVCLIHCMCVRLVLPSFLICFYLILIRFILVFSLSHFLCYS